MSELTHKQKVFCESFLITGNAREAARQAGYKCPVASAADNKENKAVQAYLTARIAAQDKKLIADANEVMAFYTSAMRGEIEDGDAPAGLADRIKAADALMRRLGIIEERAIFTSEEQNSGVVELPPLVGEQ